MLPAGYPRAVSDPTHDLDVLVLGDARPDLTLRGGELEVAFDERDRRVDVGNLSLGGSGAITARGLARLGLRTAFVGVVGDDPFGRFVLGELERAGVDISSAAVDPNRPTGVRVVLSRGSGRSFLVAPGTTPELRADLVDPDLVQRARHVHVASYFIQTELQPALRELLGVAKAARRTTSVDPNEDPNDRWNGGLLGLLDRVDVFFPNSAEVRRITGVDDIDVAAESLAERGSILAVKFGQGGGMVLRGEEMTHHEAVAVDVIDKTGAGDSFDGGFLAGFLAGWPLERCLRLAIVCGSLSMRATGGIAGQPTMEEALAALGEA
jgi:sugar/nucleoside kinase (ribokinase family)